MKSLTAKLIFSKYSTFIFDCDGVFFKGLDQIPSGVNFVNQLIDADKTVFFLTNNNAFHRYETFEKLTSFGVKASKETVYNSSYLTALYLKQYHPEVKSVYVFGREGVTEQLKEQGFDVEGGPEEDKVKMTFEQSETYVLDKTFDAVVLSYDSQVNCHKISKTVQAIQKTKVLLCTNRDRYLMKKSLKSVGTGAFVNFFETATDAKAVTCGKPNVLAFDVIMRDHNMAGVEKESVLMVGDNLETDIKFGNDIGIDTLLVMTGVTNENNLEEKLKDEKAGEPTYILDTLDL